MYVENGEVLGPEEGVYSSRRQGSKVIKSENCTLLSAYGCGKEGLRYYSIPAQSFASGLGRARG